MSNLQSDDVAFALKKFGRALALPVGVIIGFLILAKVMLAALQNMGAR